MKKIYFILCLAAMVPFFASCDKEEKKDEQTTAEDNNYSSMIVGSWRLDNIVAGENEWNPENILLIMNSDGTGLFNDNGVVENNDFTWSISGSTLTVTQRHGVGTCTIKSLTETECTLEGDSVPGMDNFQGTAIMHLTKAR